MLPPPDFAELRKTMNDALLDLVYDDSHEVFGGVSLIELDCPLDRRLEVSKVDSPDQWTYPGVAREISRVPHRTVHWST